MPDAAGSPVSAGLVQAVATPTNSSSGSAATPTGSMEAARVTRKRVSMTTAGAGVRSRRSSRHSGELAAYHDFSKRRSGSISVQDEPVGLSGFLEYRRLDGSWRPFLFQTVDFQLVLYRVHPTHQVTVMSTDIRNAAEISLAFEGSPNPKETRLLRLNINGAAITLRAISHNAAVHWVEGLQRLKAGEALPITHERATIESEDDIFEQIDKMTLEREWTSPPPPPPSAGLCGLCLPRSSSPRKAFVIAKPAPIRSEDAHVGCHIS